MKILGKKPRLNLHEVSGICLGIDVTGLYSREYIENRHHELARVWSSKTRSWYLVPCIEALHS